MHKKWPILLLWILCVNALHAQRVTVSNDINVRGASSFNIIGKVGDNILTFKDAGKEQTFDVFDNNMKYLYEKKVVLTEHRKSIYAIVPVDSTLNVYFGFINKEGYSFRIAKYNQHGTKIDTAIIVDSSRQLKILEARHVVSSDKSKVAIFSRGKQNSLNLLVFDNREMKKLWYKELSIENFDLVDDFRKIFITNDGQINILLEKNNKKRHRDKHILALVGVDENEGYFLNYIDFKDKLSIDLECEYDVKNNHVVISGLYSEDNPVDAKGYFYFIENLDRISNQNELNYVAFDDDFLIELYGDKLGKKKDLSDFVVRDLIVRNDGGFVLLTEMHKEYYRRSQYGNMGRFTSIGNNGAGWLDTYDEDVVAIAIHPDGREHWKTILYKKQFSQDEDYIYSSFFTFMTPSRLRIVYNDEIRKNNTVSEYVLNPLGKSKRRSVLSTEYQNLKLIFGEAMQISSHSYIVLSEYNNTINLVKIDYDFDI